MYSPKERHKILSNYLVYVLIPYSKVEKPTNKNFTVFSTPTPGRGILDHPEGEVESPYYDFPLFKEELSSWMNDLKCDWIWQPISLKSIDKVINHIIETDKKTKCIIFNLCDGNEVHDFCPGVSVIHLLEKCGLGFSGALPFFFNISASKTEMKKLFVAHNVSTAPFVEIKQSFLEENVREAVDHVGFPFLIKPIISCAAQGIQEKSVCWTKEDAIRQIPVIQAIPNYGEGGVFVEKFIIGREFTSFVMGNSREDVVCLPVIERVFHPNIPFQDRFFTESEFPNHVPPGEDHYTCKLADEYLQPFLQDLSKRAYVSLNGTGYGRADIRMSTNSDGTPLMNADGSPHIFILEMNAQCSIGKLDDGSPSSLTAIVDCNNLPMTEIVADILLTAITRRKT